PFRLRGRRLRFGFRGQSLRRVIQIVVVEVANQVIAQLAADRIVVVLGNAKAETQAGFERGDVVRRDTRGVATYAVGTKMQDGRASQLGGKSASAVGRVDAAETRVHPPFAQVAAAETIEGCSHYA